MLVTHNIKHVVILNPIKSILCTLDPTCSYIIIHVANVGLKTNSQGPKISMSPFQLVAV